MDVIDFSTINMNAVAFGFVTTLALVIFGLFLYVGAYKVSSEDEIPEIKKGPLRDEKGRYVKKNPSRVEVEKMVMS